MSKPSIVKTAGKKYRLYSETGTVLGTFDKMSEAKKRMVERDAFKARGKKV